MGAQSLPSTKVSERHSLDEERRLARIDLAAALRLAARFDLHEGIDNHFSHMLSDGSFLVNRWGVHWSQITASDILQVNFQGDVVDGRGEVERTAMVIHSAVHRGCPGARAIFHTHMPYATALACTPLEIEPISQNSLRFQGRIYYDSDYRGLANDLSEGERLAQGARNRPIVVMRHHGVLVTGHTVGLAFDDLYFLERAAKVQVLALGCGVQTPRISNEIVEVAGEQFRQLDNDRETHFSALKHLLDAEEPDFRQ
jgi:ribulose-5-phosphate 4-epimerase/fuculose-1-phosphate aldolase